jgi:hypothetical protein
MEKQLRMEGGGLKKVEDPQAAPACVKHSLPRIIYGIYLFWTVGIRKQRLLCRIFE